MRILYGVAATCTALMLVGYWAGYHAPGPVDISCGYAAAIVLFLSAMTGRDDE